MNKTSDLPPGARCLDCDYLLLGLPEIRCPECGREFDPTVPDTMNLSSRAMPGLARMLFRRVSWPMHLLTLTPLLFSVWEARRPGGNFNATVGGLALWLLFGAVWLTRLCLHIFLGNAYGRPSKMMWEGWRHWLVMPALILLWFWIPESEWPGALAFRFSRPAMERLIASAKQDPSATPGGQWAGVLYIHRVEVIPEGIRLYTGGGYDGVDYGYASLPDGPPEVARFGTAGHIHIRDSWYIYWDRSRLAPLPAATTAPATTAPSATDFFLP